jgi:phenylalanyl-tRNA synthetase beta chain
MAQMRTTLAGSMLEVLAYNLNRKKGDNKFFEVGKTYEILATGERCERDVLGILIESNWTPAAWNTAEGLPCGYYILKGILETFASYTGAGRLKITPNADGLPPIFNSESAAVTLGEQMHGIAGKIAGNVLDHFDIKTTAYYTELDITGFLAAPLPRPQYKPLPKFPALKRDFCFVMSEHLSAGAISEEIFRLSPLVAEVRPFDLYRGEKLGTNLKSIAFGVSLRSNEKTLTDKDVEGLCATLIRTMQEKFRVRLRT